MWEDRGVQVCVECEDRCFGALTLALALARHAKVHVEHKEHLLDRPYRIVAETLVHARRLRVAESREVTHARETFGVDFG